MIDIKSHPNLSFYKVYNVIKLNYNFNQNPYDADHVYFLMFGCIYVGWCVCWPVLCPLAIQKNDIDLKFGTHKTISYLI